MAGRDPGALEEPRFGAESRLRADFSRNGWSGNPGKPSRAVAGVSAEGRTPADWRDAIYYHFFEFPGVHQVARHRGVRSDRLKLIHFYQTDEWEFYDLEADPGELRSQYDNPVYAETVAGLKQRAGGKESR